MTTKIETQDDTRIDAYRVGTWISLEVGGDFAELTPEQARALAAELVRLAGPAPGGPFAETRTARTVELYSFGDWRNPGMYEHEPDSCGS
jgi:hypothetical protein